MKYMLILKANDDSEGGGLPDDAALDEMGAFNEELIKAGVLLAGEGLEQSATGARISYDGEDREVTDGPFAETKELIAGFWILQVASRDEAIEWARRAPLRTGQVEIRRVFEIEEFNTANEYVQKEAAWREEHGEGRTA
ncbi:MAG TPA: YciI family protein [Humibacter sp.]|jgi:hypothetical protein|nr:YciI family protein [Humibacter sp.]